MTAWRQRRLRRRLAITCQQAVELMTDYLEGALPDDERRRFEQHLSLCDACTHYLEEMRAASAALAELPPEPVDADVRAQLIELYRATRPES